MDNVAVSRRNHTFKKGNKENAQPAYGSKSFIRRDKMSAAPFQLTSGEALKKAKTVPKEGKGAAVFDFKPRLTHSRCFLTEQIVKPQKIVAKAPKPPAPGPSSKSTLGMYKGKIVQSKIGSIWKSTATVDGADPKPSAPKTGGQRVGNEMKRRSKSVADLPGHGAWKPVQTRSKSVTDRPAQVTKPAAASRPAGFHSARPPVGTVPTTLASTSSRNAKVAPTKGSGAHNAKPKIPVTNKQVNKPLVSSALSQYRYTMETAEERRAKLAEWQASKGKAFKRPAMTTAEPSKTRVSVKPEADLNPQPQPAIQCNPEPRLEARKPDSEGAVLKTHSRTPVIMNTTLDLLDNSDIDPQDSVDDIVVNLCEALEAMETPSRSDELSQGTDVHKGDQKEEMPQDVEQVKDGVEESEEGESDEECVMATSPPMETASVIKYSVKTTPYLQSVKKTIEEEASTSRSRRKNIIKDLKFLTPVRRSCRIERKASRLPPMLVDPDPCVSSLAELLKLDDDSNAYIYRKNHAFPKDVQLKQT